MQLTFTFKMLVISKSLSSFGVLSPSYLAIVFLLLSPANPNFSATSSCINPLNCFTKAILSPCD